MDSKSSNLCKICNENISKYCCPRCNILYCSLDCYKSNLHLSCSEAFYRECFMQEMSSMEREPQSKTKMQEILTRLHKEENFPIQQDDFDIANSDIVQESDNELQDSDDDDPIPDLATRLQNVDMDDCDDVWEALTSEERAEFENMLKNDDDAYKIIDLWKPWWLNFRESPMISEVKDSNQDDNEEEYEKLCPPVRKNIKNFVSITNNQPASCVKYNVINVLASYVYTTRLFNGDHHDLHFEAIPCLVLLSQNLNNNANFEDSELAIKSVIYESHNIPDFGITNPELENNEIECQVFSDVKCLIRGPSISNKIFYMLSALSDIHRLLKNKKNITKVETKDNGNFSKRFPENHFSNSISKEKIKNISLKIEYYMSYVMEYSDRICM